jgi:hypothetical protein
MSHQPPMKNPLWYQEKWTQLSVKGNFMTIIVRPKMVDDGEWIAHVSMLTSKH